MLGNQIIEDLYKEYLRLEKAYEKELLQLPEGTLYVRKIGRRFYYYTVIKNRQRGITGDREKVHALARKAFLTAATKKLEKGREAVKELLEKNALYDRQEVLQYIAARHGGIPESAFLNRNKGKPGTEKSSGRGGVTGISSGEAGSQNPIPFPKGSQTTRRGVRVRSKSELLIAEYFEEHYIEYFYEKELWCGSRRYYPDFTILRNDGKWFYWEHCGLTKEEEYMKKHDAKICRYREAGVVPWDNLIVTYDNEQGHMDMRLVEALAGVYFGR